MILCRIARGIRRKSEIRSAGSQGIQTGNAGDGKLWAHQPKTRFIGDKRFEARVDTKTPNHRVIFVAIPHVAQLADGNTFVHHLGDIFYQTFCGWKTYIYKGAGFCGFVILEQSKTISIHSGRRIFIVFGQTDADTAHQQTRHRIGFDLYAAQTHVDLHAAGIPEARIFMHHFGELRQNVCTHFHTAAVGGHRRCLHITNFNLAHKNWCTRAE